jgi:hypothetical protein
MVYSKYIHALLFAFMCVMGLSASAQGYMVVPSGVTMHVSCGTRVVVNTTRLMPADTVTYTTNDTISLSAVHTGPITSDSVGTGSVIFAANCSGGFRQAISANNDFSAWKVSLYPNPAANEVFLDTKGFSGKTDFVLLDMSGKTILNQSWEADGDEVRSLNLQSLSSGLYLFHLKNGINNASGKIIKE